MLTTVSNAVECNPNAQLRSIARAGGMVPDREAGMPSDASICFMPRSTVGRMDAEAGLHPDGEYLASPVIDLAMASNRCADIAETDGFHCGG